MKTVLELAEVERSGEFQEKEFSVNSSAEFFHMLSDTLYSDAETAVLREIGTNCYDSHVEAGKADVPFIVELPTRLEPKLRFRDFGTGLSDEDMWGIYTCYGKSNRNNSNDFAGKFGLGSKSPLALTESFTVCSYRDGKKTSYTVFRDERNIPKLAKLGSEETKEENGFEVLITIAKARFNDLSQKAQNVYKWFNTKPKITPNLTFQEEKVILEGKNYKIVTRPPNQYYDTKIAVMANVAYPIEGITWSDCLRNQNVVIFFETGDLDVTPSREKLQYSKYTKENIEKIIKGIECDIVVKVSQEIAGAKNEYIARALLRKNSFAVKTAIYNGKEISNGFIDFSKKGLDLRKKEKIYSYVNKFRVSSDVRYITPEVDDKFYFDDMPRGGIEAFRRESPIGGYYIRPIELSTTDPKTNTTTITPAPTLKEIAARIKLDESDFITTSSLPKPIIVRAKRGVSAKVKEYNYHKYGANYNYWTDATVSSTDKVHYFDTFNNRIFINKVEHQPECAQSIVDFLVHFNLIPSGTKIYGVTPSASKKLKKNWTNLSELFFNNYKKLYESEKIQDCMKDASCISGTYYINIDLIKDMIKKGLKNSELLRIVKEWDEIQVRVKNSETKLTIFQKVPIILDPVDARDFGAEITKELDKYPLFKYIERYHRDSQEVVDYLNTKI